jgi:hypothetical protein
VRDQVFILRQYDGVLAWLIIAAGGLIAVGALCLLFGVLAVSIFVVHTSWLQYLVGVASILTAGLPAWVKKAQVWAAPLRARLGWWTSYSPEVATVSVLMTANDAGAVARQLRKAGFPIPYQRIFGTLSNDPRNNQIAVAQPSHRPVVSDETFRDEVVSVLAPIGVWVNVGGVEIGMRP